MGVRLWVALGVRCDSGKEVRMTDGKWGGGRALEVVRTLKKPEEK